MAREIILAVEGPSSAANAASEARSSGVSRVIMRLPGSSRSGSNVADCLVTDSSGAEAHAAWVRVSGAPDVEAALTAAAGPDSLVIVECSNWKVIPLENLIADFRRRGKKLFAYAPNIADAEIALTVLEKGVDGLVVGPDLLPQARKLISGGPSQFSLTTAKVTRTLDLGPGERACVDTTALLSPGEGLLVGNKAGFFFLVHGETLPNEFIPTRPFRVNAGALHSYLMLGNHRTPYLSELEGGDMVTLVHASGASREAGVGRVKIERRPLVLIEAECEGAHGSVVLQRAETVRLVSPKGETISVTDLEAGDEVLVNVEPAKARHFGGEVDEFIIEK